MKNYKKVMALFMAATMVTGLAACGGNGDGETKTTPTPTPSGSQGGGDTPAPTEDPTEPELNSYTLRIDPATGEAYDLGGMEIVIRDWWSNPADLENEPNSGYQEAQRAYREWIQETYNFKIHEEAISGWGSVFEDILNYVTTGGDENNYVFVLRLAGELFSQMNNGLYYDLSTITSVDTHADKYDAAIRDFGTIDGKEYFMRKQSHEPRTGMYFNKRLLQEAGIDPEEIYELQRTHQWTWDKFEEYCQKVQADTDNDGVIDKYAMLEGNSFSGMAVFSNGGEYIGYENGMYVFKADSDATLEALTWQKRMVDTYNLPNPDTTGENWAYFTEEFKAGNAVFMAQQAYYKGQDLKDMEDEVGFVAFPMGPRKNVYTDMMQDNIHVLPACYDEDRANKIMLAYDLYYAPVPEYEDYSDYYAGYIDTMDDLTICEETIAYMGESTAVEYHNFVSGPRVGDDIMWQINENNTAAQQVEKIKNSWQAYIDAANGIAPEEGEGESEQ